jgi:hypothetical protein
MGGFLIAGLGGQETSSPPGPAVSPTEAILDFGFSILD